MNRIFNREKKYIWRAGLSFILILSLMNLQACSAASDANPVKPNLLFILLDDLGKEWVSGYDAEEIETPAVDGLAEEGMLFTNAWSMPQCTPTRVALMTGQYPWRNGWINHYDVPRWGHGAHFDPHKYPSLARTMKQAGYATCVAGKWQVNDFRLDPEVMHRHGFDEYCMWTGAEGGNVKASQERYWDPYIHTEEGSRTYEGEFGEDIFSDFIIDFMEKHRDEPMMIYYPMCLPHGPLTTTPLEPEVSGKMDMHKAMVRYTDYILGKLLSAMEDLGIRNETIVFWTTDNGTAGSITGNRLGRAVEGGKTLLSENGINAPFIVNCPGKIPQGVHTDALTDFTDILPTFAELGGASLPEGHVFDGHSMAELLLGKTMDSERDWILGMGSHPAMIRDGRLHPAHGYRDRVLRDKQYKAYVDTIGHISRIYDIVNDPWEEENLLPEKSDKSDRSLVADPGIEAALEKFRMALDGFPGRDASPQYTKLDGSLYDIPVEELNKKAAQGKQKPNKSPVPSKTNPDRK